MPATANPLLGDLPQDLDIQDGQLKLVRRIVVSKHFIRSPRLAALLEFLCEQSTHGNIARLTEYQIARQVFSRKGRFDPNADTIVRSHMVRLRQKLVLYFQEEGAQETLRISIPRGGYAPLFEHLPQVQHAGLTADALYSSQTPADEILMNAPSLDPATEDTQTVPLPGGPLEFGGGTAPHVKRGTAGNRWKWLGIAVALVSLAWWSIALLRHHRLASASPSEQLWAQLMPAARPVLLIPADSSLVLLHYHMTHDTSLADYISGRYLEEIHALQRTGVDTMGLEGRRYTSIVDLRMTQWLTQLAIEHRAVFNVRYPRDINLEDVKKENVVISGSLGANPWLELYEPMLNFNISGIPEKHLMVVSNRSPRVGEQKEYIADQPPEHVTYGVLAFLPGIERSRDTLILQGTSLAGTEAISDLIFDHTELDVVLQNFRRPDGSIRHFEALLSGENVNGSSVRFKILASRMYH